MKCESALELLLDAEPSEFSAHKTTPLGEHLRGCARCRRVATQLQNDTHRLAVAMETAVHMRRPARRVMAATMVPALAMAAIMFAVVLRNQPEPPSITQSVNEPVTMVAPAVPATTASPAGDAPPTGPRASRDVRREPKAFARAIPLAPVRLVPLAARAEPISVEPSAVTVTPPAGTRATVMHTSNPKLVVVWLY